MLPSRKKTCDDYSSATVHPVRLGWDAPRRAEFGRELLAGAQIDLHGRNCDALFRQGDADAARVWRELVIVELHCAVLHEVCSCIETGNHFCTSRATASEPVVIKGLAARSR